MLRSLVKRGLAALPFALKYEMFYQSARALGVTAYQSGGAIGPIFGPLYDQSFAKGYLRARDWAPELTKLFLDFFREGHGTFLDIGANVGAVILPISRTGVHCIAYEPEPGNYSLLRANIAVHRASNIEIRNVAVSDQHGKLRFFTDPYNSGDHRLSEDGLDTVDCIRLDDSPIPDGPLGIKIDTQGAEPKIFAGGENTLAAAGLIVFEFWPWGMKRMGTNPENIFAFMATRFGVSTADISSLRDLWQQGGQHDFLDVVLDRNNGFRTIR